MLSAIITTNLLLKLFDLAKSTVPNFASGYAIRPIIYGGVAYVR